VLVSKNGKSSSSFLYEVPYRAAQTYRKSMFRCTRERCVVVLTLTMCKGSWAGDDLKIGYVATATKKNV
jgi:hypothetical protein